MTAIPAAPSRPYSFTNFSTVNPTTQQPGVQIDASIDNTNAAVGGLIGAVSVSLNADGSLKSSALEKAFEDGSGTWVAANIFNAPAAASAAAAAASAQQAATMLQANQALPGAGAPGVLTSDGSGHFAWVRGGSPLAGVVADGQRASVYVSMAVGSNQLFTSSPVFALADVGKYISVLRFDIANGWSPWYHGTTGALSVAKIVGYTSPTQITIDRVGDAAPFMAPTFPTQPWPYAATASQIMWGTDNSAVIQAALNAGGEVVLPAGNIAVNKPLTIPSNTMLRGAGSATVIYPLGIGSLFGLAGAGCLFGNPALVSQWAAYEGAGHTMPSLTAALDAVGDHDITIRDLSVDLTASGLAVGGLAGRFFLVRRFTLKNIRFIGSTFAHTGAFDICACENFDITDNVYENIFYCFEPWGGVRNFCYQRNHITLPRFATLQDVTYGGVHTDPANGAWINVVGTQTADSQESYGFSVRDNRVYMAGADTLQAEAIGLGIFPDDVGSTYRDWEVTGNEIFCTGTRNIPLLFVGGGRNGRVSGNLIDGADGTTGSPLHLSGEPQVGAPGLPTSVTATNGNVNIVVNWTGHAFTGANLALAPAWFYAVTSPFVVVGGITINGYFRITAVIDANTLWIAKMDGTAPTSTQTVAWPATGNFAQIARYPVGITVEGNRFVNCSAPGNGLITAQGSGIKIRDNDAINATGNALATGNYLCLVYSDPISSEPGHTITHNTGPAGSGALSAGQLGNNRVAWNRYTGTPVVVDPEDTSGSTNNFPQVLAGGVTVTNGASLAGTVTINGSTPVTLASQSGVAVSLVPTGSPFTYTPTSRGTLLVGGGTVSTIALNRGAFSMNTGQTSGPQPMSAGDLAIVTYTAAPTIWWVPA